MCSPFVNYSLVSFVGDASSFSGKRNFMLVLIMALNLVKKLFGNDELEFQTTLLKLKKLRMV